MQKNKSNTVEKVQKLVEPIINNLKLELWDIEFVKEGSEYFLRIYIDTPNGVDINDCEKVSKAIDKPLDELDPIDSPYNLEVSSPGVERKLTKAEHFKKFIGSEVKTKLIRPDENKIKEYIGNLKDFSDETVTLMLEDGNETIINFKNIAYVKLNNF